MTVQFDFQLNLDDPKLVQAMANVDPVPPEVRVDEFFTDPLEWLEAPRKVNLVDLHLSFKLGSSSPADNLAVSFTQVCTLSVSPSRERGVQTTADVSTAARQPVDVEVFMAVFATGATAPQQALIEGAFRGLTTAGADIENFDIDAAVDQLEQQGVGEDLYHLGTYARISRRGKLELAAPTTCEALESRYPPDGNDELVQYPYPNTRPPSHAKAWCSLCRYSPDPPKPSSGNNIKEYDDIGQGDVVPPEVATDIEVYSRELSKGIDCNDAHFDIVQRRLFTLFQYPEFRLEPAIKVISFKIFRHRIRIRIHYLQLQIRYTKIALMGFSRVTGNANPHDILDQVGNCLLEAFVVSAIASFALANPGAAAPVFQQWFIECMRRWAADLLRCVVVGLFFAKERGAWNAV